MSEAPDDRPRKAFDAGAVVAAVPMARAIAAVEQALVELALGRPAEQIAFASGGALGELAAAVCGALASRFLAVGTPRSLGLIAGAGGGALADLCREAHRAWFAPRELRTGDPRDACAADIVCVCDDAAVIDPSWLRAGTHVNLLRGALDLAALPRAVVADTGALAAMVAGVRDGRQLDELTIFAPRDLHVAELAIARAAAGAGGPA